MISSYDKVPAQKMISSASNDLPVSVAYANRVIESASLPLMETLPITLSESPDFFKNSRTDINSVLLRQELLNY